jgi:hypothetical protein
MFRDRRTHDAAALVREHHEDKNSRPVAVGITKKSAAMIWWTWLARKVRQDWDGGRRGRTRYCETLA